MENYKEKYEKALKVASQWHNNGISSVKTVIECIFPELAQSEDERIRKAIMSIIAFSPEAMFNRVSVTRENCLAWLEKQKVNPFSGVSFEYNNDVWGMCARDNGVDILLNGTLFYQIDKIENKKCSHINKNKDEQKPAWSEEDNCTTNTNTTNYAKSNEEKAEEICGKGNPCCNKLCQFCNLSFVIEDVKQMAQWKDEQMIDFLHGILVQSNLAVIYNMITAKITEMEGE